MLTVPARGFEPDREEGNVEEARGTERKAREAVGADSSQFAHVPAAHDARHVAALAAAYLDAGIRGEPCGELALCLACAVLDENTVRLARLVLAGGPFAHARATELAALVLRGAQMPDASATGARRQP